MKQVLPKGEYELITDLVKFTIKQEHLEEAIEQIKELAIHILDEEACPMIKVFQSRPNANELYMLLGWENRKAMELLRATEQSRRFRKNINKMLTCPPEHFDWDTII